MQDRFYRVWIEVEAINMVRHQSEKLGERRELATFLTLSEARDFCTEMVQRHTAQVTAETELVEEMTSPGIFSAGD